jgi:hypothetical protein
MPQGNRQHPCQTGLFAHRVLSIQQDESLVTTVYELIAEHSTTHPGGRLVMKCPPTPGDAGVVALEIGEDLETGNFLKVPQVAGGDRITPFECAGSDQQVIERDDDALP